MSPANANLSRSMWRKDFSVVDPAARRVARYALQMLARSPTLHGRLRDDDFLGPLWVIALPLVDPAILARLEAEWNRPDHNDTSFSGNESFFDEDLLQMAEIERGRRLPGGVPGARMRDYLRARFSAIPDHVIARLAQDDGTTPTHPSVVVLADCAGLNEAERRLLDFTEKKESVALFRPFLREAGVESVRDRYACLSAALDVGVTELRHSVARSAPLVCLQLIRRGTGRRSDLEDFIQAGDMFEDILGQEPTTPEALLATVVEPAAAPECGLEDFPHLAGEAYRVRSVLSEAATRSTVGVNALLYGPPGSGKTQFASAVAKAAGLMAYQVKTADEDGDGMSRSGRLGAYQLTQRMLRGRRDCVVVFDEVEDAFGSAEGSLLAFYTGKPTSGLEKGWMNRTLEGNPVPALWITNDAGSMDPAFLRRFLLPVAFTAPPRRVRRQIAEQHLGHSVTAAVLDELAADAALMPAQFSSARRLLELHPGRSPDIEVRQSIAATRRVLHGMAGPRLRRAATRFDPAYLNLADGVCPLRLMEALNHAGRGTLCFYGPPGTGKTEFAHVLADALDRELVVKASSDLVSPYVGETERNIARLFAEIDVEHSILLLDEVDSVLRDRKLARHSWETTQVNELLQQMERFDGILIAATNLMNQLDGAAMRRFDFKLQFRALNRTQRLSLFAREALGDVNQVDAIPAPLVAHLESLDHLTPGDFANVVRQRDLLSEALAPVDFMRRLIAECRYKAAAAQAA